MATENISDFTRGYQRIDSAEDQMSASVGPIVYEKITGYVESSPLPTKKVAKFLVSQTVSTGELLDTTL
jgi:hypothetical protein